MIRNIIGPLIAGVLGFFCVIGADGDNGAIQLISLIVMCLGVGFAFALAGFKYFGIVLFYCLAFTAGTLLSVFAHRAWGV